MFLIVALIHYSPQSCSKVEGMEIVQNMQDRSGEILGQVSSGEETCTQNVNEIANTVAAATATAVEEQLDNASPVSETQDASMLQYENIYNNKSETFSASDYLPTETNNDWFETDFVDMAQLNQENLIDAQQRCQPLDTVGQTLKAPSYDIRGRPPNPKMVVSPWGNSSYEPDTNIKGLGC